MSLFIYFDNKPPPNLQAPLRLPRGGGKGPLPTSPRGGEKPSGWFFPPPRGRRRGAWRAWAWAGLGGACVYFFLLLQELLAIADNDTLVVLVNYLTREVVDAGIIQSSGRESCDTVGNTSVSFECHFRTLCVITIE